MDGNMLIAIFSFAGTAFGTIGGILAANKLTNFRLQKLEEKVDKHNCLIERMVAVEVSTKSAHHRIDEIIEKT
ncbi:hypothetical protein SDC9_192176 [bioreactor metagenome]|uniref:Uncharacterized protein n=1 Tax=bioreactor metagenome TaxID=1076179 RepID=A0A645HZY4_9ZZZZ